MPQIFHLAIIVIDVDCLHFIDRGPLKKQHKSPLPQLITFTRCNGTAVETDVLISNNTSWPQARFPDSWNNHIRRA